MIPKVIQKAVIFSILVLSIGASISAHADDLDFDGYRKFLMSGNTGSKKLAIQSTCTSAEGAVYRVGEAGYDSCLNTARAAAESKQTGGEKSERLPGSTAPSGPSVGTTIHLGE